MALVWSTYTAVIHRCPLVYYVLSVYIGTNAVVSNILMLRRCRQVNDRPHAETDALTL